MNNEIEATFTNINKEDLRSKLNKLQAKLIKPEFLQTRIAFNLPNNPVNREVEFLYESDQNFVKFKYNDRYFKLKISSKEKIQQILYLFSDSNLLAKENNGWLRVRNEIDKITLTYKRQDSNDIDGMKEIELEVDSLETARAFIEYLGADYKAYQETKRELWQLGDVEIMIDEWPFLEPFVEIEGNSAEAVKEISEKLGFSWKNAYFGAVTELYSKKYNLSEEIINDSTPKIVFGEENPFLNR